MHVTTDMPRLPLAKAGKEILPAFLVFCKTNTYFVKSQLGSLGTEIVVRFEAKIFQN